ncbi:MAG: glutaminyl-peptide cyclotransferase [Planctomycetes bacterium]|nr:glutaminyl-peptide cyclotransferase [Planctomycetota bacterium]
MSTITKASFAIAGVAALAGVAVLALQCGPSNTTPAPNPAPIAQTPPKPEPPAPAKPEAPKLVVTEGYEVVNTFPHDASSYTQGLVLDGGRFIESQGQYGESSLRFVEVETGRVLKKLPLESRYFAEGCAVLKGLVYQLTWQQHVVFVYDARDLSSVGSFPLEGEGWGITTDGTSLIVSDGTDTLRVLDPTTHAVTKKLPVRVQGRALYQLNELEWIEGEVWANVWHTDRIARIDPKTGEVARFLDLTGLLPAHERRDHESVLNGIAYDPAKKRIFVTGKNWPRLFEIRVKR